MFLLREGLPQASPAGGHPSRWEGSGRGAAMSAGGAAGLPAPRWRPPARYRAAPAGGEGGSSPTERGAEKRAQILVVITFTILKNSYYFTIFRASPEPVNLREVGGRFRCWLSVVKKRWEYRRGCAGAFKCFGAMLEHPGFPMRILEFHFFHEF